MKIFIVYIKELFKLISYIIKLLGYQNKLILLLCNINYKYYMKDNYEKIS